MNSSIDESIVIELKGFLKKESWSKPFFEWADRRRNDASKTPIERIEKLTGLDYYDVVRIAKMLQKLGLARFVVGRKGSSSRIEWWYSVRNIGAVTLGKTSKLSEISDEIDDDEDKITAEGIVGDDNAQKIGKIEHVFALRPDFSIKFDLPADFTAKEAERLAGFVATLPFEAA